MRHMLFLQTHVIFTNMPSTRSTTPIAGAGPIKPQTWKDDVSHCGWWTASAIHLHVRIIWCFPNSFKTQISQIRTQRLIKQGSKIQNKNSITGTFIMCIWSASSFHMQPSHMAPHLENKCGSERMFDRSLRLILCLKKRSGLVWAWNSLWQGPRKSISFLQKNLLYIICSLLHWPWYLEIWAHSTSLSPPSLLDPKQQRLRQDNFTLQGSWNLCTRDSKRGYGIG